MIIKSKAPFYMGGGIGTELNKFDLQKFAIVDNPYTDELEEDLSITGTMNFQVSTFSLTINVGLSNYNPFYGYSNGMTNGDSFGSSYFAGFLPQCPLIENYYHIFVTNPGITNTMDLGLVKNNNYDYPPYCKLRIFDKGNMAGDQNIYNTTLRLVDDIDTGNTVTYKNNGLDENIYNLFYACYSNGSDLGISGEFTDTV